MTIEANFDALAGPTHIYGGLSYGNIASQRSGGRPSNPRAAAKEGLEKMWFLTHHLGLVQGVLPPHQRPFVPALRSLGFSGSSASEVVRAAALSAPELLIACSSAAAMWAANAATVTAASDSGDGRLHFTAANLVSKFHRSIEAEQTARILQAIFHHPAYFAHHEPLSFGAHFADEGAANHSRLCLSHAARGLHFFVYGRHWLKSKRQTKAAWQTQRFAPRQTLEGQQAIARRHGIAPQYLIFAQQHPLAIDAGVFHNDVIAVANENVLLYHEYAWVDTPRVIDSLRRAMRQQLHGSLKAILVTAAEVSLSKAVSSYLFNSQLLSLPSGEMVLLAPQECAQERRVQRWLQKLEGSGDCPWERVYYVDLTQSMQNGGGPACLRLRVPLTRPQLSAISGNVLLTAELYSQLHAWIERHYRDRLSLGDLADPSLMHEAYGALDELTSILGLGSIYPFQGV